MCETGSAGNTVNSQVPRVIQPSVKPANTTTSSCSISASTNFHLPRESDSKHDTFRCQVGQHKRALWLDTQAAARNRNHPVHINSPAADDFGATVTKPRSACSPGIPVAHMISQVSSIPERCFCSIKDELHTPAVAPEIIVVTNPENGNRRNSHWSCCRSPKINCVTETRGCSSLELYWCTRNMEVESVLGVVCTCAPSSASTDVPSNSVRRTAACDIAAAVGLSARCDVPRRHFLSESRALSSSTR
jgi:hypothetical protein